MRTTPLLFTLATLVSLSACTRDTASSGERNSNAPKSAVHAEAAAAQPTEVVAVLNGKNITNTDLEHEIERKPMLAMQKKIAGEDPTKVANLRYYAVTGMINRQLLVEAALKSGIPNEPQIAERVKGIVEQYGGEDSLSGMLKTMNTSLPEFKSEVANDFRIRSYIEENLAKNVTISPEEVKATFDAAPGKFAEPEQVHARHILIKADSKSTPEQTKAAENEINKLYTMVTAPGADFGTVAKEHSQCPSAPEGGDLHFFSRGQMVPEFEQAAFALKPGEISKPIHTQFGYHIIKLEERKEASKPDFEKAKPTIEQELKAQKVQKLVEARLEELRKAASVEMKIPGPNAA